MKPRIALIDGLRGIAALAVVLYHYNTRIPSPSYLGALIKSGNLGVSLFFVLSGFVITMSLGDRLISPRYLGQFALRRSLRLDPPYFCAIVVMILLAIFGSRFGVHANVPDVATLAAHVFYLQDLLHRPAILPIFWSLCLELQFYLVIALLLFAMQRGKTPSQRVGTPYYQAVFLASIVASVACRHYSVGNGAFMPFWFCFALGASTYWASADWTDRRYTYAACLFVLGYGLLCQDAWAITAALSAGLILAASIANRLDFLGSPVPQFFGRISYSIYLTHLIFGWYALSIAQRFTSPPIAYAIGLIICVVSAWAWYRLIELPAVLLSRRIRLRGVAVEPSTAVHAPNLA